MNIVELLLLCILIIGILLFVISRIRSSPPQQTFVPSSAGEEILDDLTAELRRRLQANQKIAAIKLYRERTGATLKEAKDAVEWIADNALGPVSLSPQWTAKPSLEDEATLDGQTFEALHLANWNEIQRLLLVGQKIAAIKLYRYKTGASLREAKDSIDRLEKEMR